MVCASMICAFRSASDPINLSRIATKSGPASIFVFQAKTMTNGEENDGMHYVENRKTRRNMADFWTRSSQGSTGPCC